MKPNGNKLVVRSVVFASIVIALLSAVSNAETMRGTFKLPTETRWGAIVLAPGKYQFSVDTQSTGKVVVVESEDSRWSGMIMAVSLSDAGSSRTRLELAKSETGSYVKALYLGEIGVALNFDTPKPGREVHLTKVVPAPSTASASGSH